MNPMESDPNGFRDIIVTDYSCEPVPFFAYPYTVYGQLARRAVSTRVAVNIDVRREQIQMGMGAIEILF